MNRAQKIAGFIFVVIILFVSLCALITNSPIGAFGAVVGVSISAGLVILCLSSKPK